MDTLFVKKSVSFHHFLWFLGPAGSKNHGFWPFGHTFYEKKCVILTFSINLAGVLASQTRIISFIYKTDKVLEKISFRISSFIYELRRVLRRRLYAGRNFPVWGATWDRGRPGSGDVAETLIFLRNFNGLETSRDPPYLLWKPLPLCFVLILVYWECLCDVCVMLKGWRS